MKFVVCIFFVYFRRLHIIKIIQRPNIKPTSKIHMQWLNDEDNAFESAACGGCEFCAQHTRGGGVLDVCFDSDVSECMCVRTLLHASGTDKDCTALQSSTTTGDTVEMGHGMSDKGEADSDSVLGVWNVWREMDAECVEDGVCTMYQLDGLEAVDAICSDTTGHLAVSTGNEVMPSTSKAAAIALQPCRARRPHVRQTRMTHTRQAVQHLTRIFEELNGPDAFCLMPYESSPMPTHVQKQAAASALHLSIEQVENWFYNKNKRVGRRMKM